MRALLDLLLPAVCPACRRADGPDLCPPCAAAMPRLGPACPWCAAPQAAAQVGCHRCHGAGYPHLQAVAVATAYDAVMAALITAAKAGARPAAVRVLGDHIADPPAAWALAADAVIVPVPPSPGRRPGPHLATALAAAVARRTRRRLRRLLRHTRHALPQHRLGGHARAGNVAGLFACPRPAPAEVVLVDDLITSGATLSAAAGALRAAGARRVYGLCLARTPDRDDPPTLGAPWAGTDEP
jgi:predicted amidophosphoribosyltransferase